MKPISVSEICQIVRGRSLTPAPEQSPMIRAVCTDTRQMRGQSLFVALRGENFDGHEFLETAAGAGAVAALIDRPPQPPGLPPTTMQLIQVADAKAAMGELAEYVRQQMRGKVIAVAGSNGKTGTKHLIHGALGGGTDRAKLRGTISPKSFNNDIGVPLAIFPADPEQDYLVLEMGTNHPGEVGVLTRIGMPDIGVITNCSAEHLEGLGDLSGVRRENGCLIEGINPDGVLIVNGDDVELLEAVSAFKGRKVRFGLSPHNDLFAADIQCDERGTRFTLIGGKAKAFVPVLGRHSAMNALAAIAVARELGLKDEEILKNLAVASGPNMRLQLQQASPGGGGQGVRILNDAYNANPASMKAAIETLAVLPTAGRKIAVIGDMRELGDSSVKLHAEVGRLLALEHVPDLLVCVGPLAKIIADEAMKVGLDGKRIEHFSDAVTAAGEVSAIVESGDLVLLKASRAIGLEVVASAIFAEPSRAS